jgi:hypothetical protein
MYTIHKISIYKYCRRLVILSIGAQNPDIYPYPYLFLYIQNYKWHVNGLFHLISVHPLSRIHVFHGYTPEEFQAQNLLPLKNSKIASSKPFNPEEFQAQNPLPLKNSKRKTFYPWRIPSSKSFTPEEFQALKNFNLKPLYPWRIPSSKPFTPEEFQAKNPLPWIIPGILDRGGGGYGY